MTRAVLLALLTSVLAAFLSAYAEHAGAQRSRQQADRIERARSKLKDIPLPARPTDPPKSEPKPTTDKKTTESEPEDAPPPPDEWPQEEIARALRECIRLLAPIAAEIDVTVPIKSGACGAPAPVSLRKVGRANPVVLSPPVIINCPMVVALHRWVETQLQPQALRLLGSHVVSLSNVSAYSCRRRNGSSSGRLSEHALANAIDIGRFETADGQKISVAGDWGPTERDIKESAAKARQDERRTARRVSPPAQPPAPQRRIAARKSRSMRSREIPLPERRPEPSSQATVDESAVRKANREAPGGVPVLKPAVSNKAKFLKKVHEEACGLFGTVLGPEANEAHRDHFHFDLAPRRSRAFCE